MNCSEPGEQEYTNSVVGGKDKAAVKIKPSNPSVWIARL